MDIAAVIESLPLQSRWGDGRWDTPYSVVYLDLIRPESLQYTGFAQSRIRGAQAWMEMLGYERTFGYGEIGCDPGAAEALGISGDWWGIGLWFETPAQAAQYRDAHIALTGRAPAGVADGVLIGCAD